MFSVVLETLASVSIHGFELVGMAMGLEFKLGSEILRTVIVRELSEVALVAAIIAVRAALTFLIHWEIKTEKEGH